MKTILTILKVLDVEDFFLLKNNILSIYKSILIHYCTKLELALFIYL
jgi:hypothetical protein